MPITFIDIERQKSWRIAALFSLLVALYFLFALIVVQALVLFIAGLNGLLILTSLKYVAAVFSAALIIAAVHFIASGYSAVQRVTEQLQAVPPDPEDGIHRQLMNIMEEIHIASGNRKNIACLIIPTFSLNALAVTDLRGTAVIAITEGLLSRLTRAQLEAVVAHEAYHVLSGDCFDASVATSLFGMYAGAVDQLRSAASEDVRAAPLLGLFWVLNLLASVVRMFISREREYRADAGAVRMTRNPLALAEALHLIAGRWTGSGFISEGIEMLCISSPSVNQHDDSEGWWHNLLSTHPPISSRIGILLNMARVSPSVLKEKADTGHVQDISELPLYYVLDPENAWLGPFSVAELATFPWLTPRTWVSTALGKKAQRIADYRSLDAIFHGRRVHEGHEGTNLFCPACQQPLVRESYEKTALHRCTFCRGTLVENAKIPRILARTEGGCPDRIASLLRAVTADNQRSLSIRRNRSKEKKNEPALHCPRCGREMFRTFYSYAFLIELDKCGICRLTWFDADELAMLQCLVENSTGKNFGAVKTG